MATPSALAAFAASRHHVVTTAELYELGFSRAAIRHLVATQRSFRIHRGVYAVGRQQLTSEGRWKAAVAGGPPGCGLGLISDAVHWELLRDPGRHATKGSS